VPTTDTSHLPHNTNKAVNQTTNKVANKTSNKALLSKASKANKAHRDHSKVATQVLSQAHSDNHPSVLSHQPHSVASKVAQSQSLALPQRDPQARSSP